ncbi:hypothetical protein ANN_27211 [Periplaneta americana]|uniref:Uncharacterized protein n=1 Tax=Periplaneta americana TaxID=6978 RepID=A0ABQ8RXM0_PERAM|nr:hypothetical protein ANN_27211 [Periplaneta americana]
MFSALLPPYMCDLSAIELAWSSVKNYVRSHNTTGDMSLKRLQELVQEGLKSVTKEDCTGYCKHVSDIENYYWEKDAIMEDVIDEFIINVGDTDTSDDDSSDESDDDSHNDSNTEDEDEESFMSDFVPCSQSHMLHFLHKIYNHLLHQLFPNTHTHCMIQFLYNIHNHHMPQLHHMFQFIYIHKSHKP